MLTDNYPPSSFRSVVLIIPVLCCGGAEMCIVGMSNWWAAKNVKVTLISFNKDNPAYPLDPRVLWLSLEDFSGEPRETSLWPEESGNIFRLRRALEYCLRLTEVRPLPVISFLSRMNLRTILASEDLPVKVVVSERVYPPFVSLFPPEESLREKLYPKAHMVVMQTDRCRNMWGSLFLSKEKMAVIPNSVNDISFHPFVRQTSCLLSPSLKDLERYILTAGRLELQKQFNLFIDAFAMIASQFPFLQAVIAGEGSLKEDLENQVKTLNLESRIHFPGKVDDVLELARNAEVFVLTSKFEGFPNVVLESMSVGCPVVSFDCPTGPDEIIRNGVDGVLVECDNVPALSESIREFLDDPALRKNMGCSAREVCQRFSLEKVMGMWEELFV